MALTLTDWIPVFESEYLAEFVPSGGSSVKIVSSAAGSASLVLDSLGAAGGRRGFLLARLDAGETRIQFIDQVFFAVSRQVDWVGLSQNWLRGQFAANGLVVPADQPLSDLDAIAAGMGISPREVMGEVRRWIFNGLQKDYGLAREFRTAIAMLCQAALNPVNVSPDDVDVLVKWLRGERTSSKALKKLQIFSRIGRHNARYLLTSLSRWAHLNGHAGLVVLIDAGAVWNLPPEGPPEPKVKYSRNACLDFFEVLRQFIDETDELQHFLLAVAVPSEFWTDPKKGVAGYSALQMRVADEVRDRNQANPLGAAVRLEVPMEVHA